MRTISWSCVLRIVPEDVFRRRALIGFHAHLRASRSRSLSRCRRRRRGPGHKFLVCVSYPSIFSLRVV